MNPLLEEPTESHQSAIGMELISLKIIHQLGVKKKKPGKEYTSLCPLAFFYSNILLENRRNQHKKEKKKKANLKDKVRHAWTLKSYGLDEELEFCWDFHCSSRDFTGCFPCREKGLFGSIFQEIII